MHQKITEKKGKSAAHSKLAAEWTTKLLLLFEKLLNWIDQPNMQFALNKEAAAYWCAGAGYVLCVCVWHISFWFLPQFFSFSSAGRSLCISIIDYYHYYYYYYGIMVNFRFSSFAESEMHSPANSTICFLLSSNLIWSVVNWSKYMYWMFNYVYWISWMLMMT